MVVRRLLAPIVAVAFLSSGCGALSLLFGVGPGETVSGSETTRPLPADVFQGGRFIRCTGEGSVTGTPAAAPPDTVDLHGIGEEGTLGIDGISVRLTVKGTPAHPSLAIGDEITGSGGMGETAAPRRAHGPWGFGPTTISVEDGPSLTYGCELARS